METRKKIILSVALATFIFSGCSVKPEAIKPEVIKKDVTKTMSVLNKTIQAVTKPISLDEAIQRAIDHNLNRRVDILNIALAEQKLDVIAYESLPKLTTQAGYKGRDSYAASQSVTYDPATDSVTGTTGDYSVSSNKKDDISAGIGFSWNILDFGVSYVRANQQANRFLMEKEKERKSIYNIKQEVRNAYYKAVSADELLKRLTPIMEETKKAFEDSKKIRKLRLDSPIESLTYQRELLEVIRSLNTLEASLNQSKIRLSQLMGLKPGTKFELSEKIKDKYNLPSVNISLQELEKLALENRPELNESRYQIKISQDEVKASMMKMLPGISLNLGYDYSNSDYLANNQWTSYGASISYNLLNVFNAPIHRKYAKTQVELAKQQKLALSMAVVSQVHLSMIDLAQAKKEYKLSEEYFAVAKEIYNIIENENSLDVNGKLSLIKEKLNFLISNLRLSSSYAKVQNAYGKVITSIGNEKVFEEKPVLETKKEVKPKLVVVKEEPKKVVVTDKPIKEVDFAEVKFDETKPYLEVIKSAKLVDKAGGDYKVIKTINKGEKLNFANKIYSGNGNYWYEMANGGYLYVGKVVEFNNSQFDENLPSIEITKAAKLVNMPGGNYQIIKEYDAGEKLNFVRKVEIEGKTPWYETTNGGFIHSSKAQEVIKEEPKKVIVEKVKAEKVVVQKAQEVKEFKEEPAAKIEEVKTPTIEITNTAKLVNQAGGNYQTIEMMGIGEELQYKRKIIKNGNIWYEIVGGGYIHSSKAKEIK